MWNTIGHSTAVALLQRSLAQKKLAHAYLFVGPAQVGKMTLAIDLARALNCEADEPPCGKCAPCQKISLNKFADVWVISLTSHNGAEEVKAQSEISIEQIRQVQSSASLPPFEGKCKVFIIDGAEFMSTEAANCLLKTLEEPAHQIVFILLTVSEHLVMPTVISRCQRIELIPLATADIEAELNRRGTEPLKARLLARLSHGCPGWAILATASETLLQERAEKLDRLLDIIDNDYEKRFIYAAGLATDFYRNRKRLQEVLDLWLDWWRDLMLIKTENQNNILNIDFQNELVEQSNIYSLAQIRSAISRILSASSQFRQNANPQLVLEVLMLNIPKKEGGVREASLYR